MKIIDLAGREFARLKVVSLSNVSTIKTKFWNCICSCGKETVVSSQRLRSGKTKSCGCLRSELSAKRKYTHGKSNTPEHRAWKQMNRRCDWPKGKSYIHYGGRGITVCERWRHSFENFISDMGIRPSKNHSIDRIDVNGNYCPENCKWSTKEEQMYNQRKTVRIDFCGVIKTLNELSQMSGVKKPTIKARHFSGKRNHELIAPVRAAV